MAKKPRTKEEWVQYILSSLEKNSENGCWVFKGRKNKEGYGAICINKKGNQKYLRAHRLIYEHYFGPIPKGMLICHDCDNPPCVNPDHLFIGTNKDNMYDKVEKGRASRTIGEKSGMCKLTKAQVEAIRNDKRRQTEIAKDYGVVKSTICMIKNRTSRKYE